MLRIIARHPMQPKEYNILGEGDRVVYTGPGSSLASAPLEATIVEYGGLLYVEWDSDKTKARLDSIVPEFLERIPKENIKPELKIIIKELKCKVCSRMNALSAKKCWWCEVDKPTS